MLHDLEASIPLCFGYRGAGEQGTLREIESDARGVQRTWRDTTTRDKDFCVTEVLEPEWERQCEEAGCVARMLATWRLG